MATKTAVKKDTRKKYFNTILEKLNDETGLDFTLDELRADPEYKYAHGTHQDAGFKITCQMDTDLDKKAYGFYLHTEQSSQLSVPEHLLGKIRDIVKTDAYKTRTATLELLNDLNKRLYIEIDRVTSNLLEGTVNDTEKEDAYATITATAREILRR